MSRACPDRRNHSCSASSGTSTPLATTAAAAWLALPVGTLATLLPSTPGYIGTFDYFAIAAAEAGGNSTTASTAFAVLVHAYFYIPATLIGGVCLLIWRFQRGRE